MGYHTLLVNVDDDPKLEERLRTARALAQRFDAFLLGLHVVPPPVLPVGYGEAVAYVGPELVEAQRKAARERAERLEARFRELVAELVPEVAWRLIEGDAAHVLPEQAHCVDLTLVSQTETRGLEVLEPDLAEYLAMSAGGPVLVLPASGWREDLGRRILVGWNGSRQACRAVHDALPFLAGAEEVVMMAIGEEAALTLEDAVAMLARHEVEVQAVRLGDEPRPGARLLEEAARRSIDMLVMGAYGHARWRELILGGTTRHVLQHAELPVLASS